MNRALPLINAPAASQRLMSKLSAELMEVGRCLHIFPGMLPCPGAPLSCGWVGVTSLEACRESFGINTPRAMSRELLQGAQAELGLHLQ